MKTIELMIGGQIAQFTTKSVTFDGKEYFYSNMTNILHSPIILTYSFDYDGETKRLAYQKKDAKVMAAIFSQVHKMEELKKQQATAAAEPFNESAAPVEKAEPAAKPAAEPEAETSLSEEATAEPEAEAPVYEETAEAPVSEETAETEKAPDDTMEAMVQATIALNEERAKKQAEKEAKKAKRKAIREAKKNGTPIPEEYLNEESEDKESAVDPEKQEKIKKSLKIFGIIIAAVLVVSVIYYFAFGTSSAPTEKSPNNTESQQYDDIDQLIDDMQ